MQRTTLTPQQLAILRNKDTELPGSGEYNDFGGHGTYLCRGCGLALFRATSKFISGCGWPSFDEEIEHHVKHLPDADGRRTEIVCARCGGHLGHVFMGENFTDKNTRHCVNSLALDFVADDTIMDSEEALLAAGCFWGVEYYLKKLPGVLTTEPGYTGGHVDQPSYEDVCQGNTGHIEAVRVLFDPKQLTYENLLKYFFEIHDPTQQNGQGPDIGEQYLSVIFYENEAQRQIAEQIIQLLKSKGLSAATELRPAKVFWKAESYHQDYYQKTGKAPYCHRYVKRF